MYDPKIQARFKDPRLTLSSLEELASQYQARIPGLGKTND
jgi:hypothetical protein